MKRKPKAKLLFGILLAPSDKTEEDYRKLRPKRQGKHPWRGYRR
jgi:hypothetical protein